MSGIHNAHARLDMAVDALATLSHSLKARLIYAAFHIINDMKAEDLPPGDLRSEYENVVALLTRLPPQPPSDGGIQATIHAMTDADAEEASRRIVALARKVAEETSRLNSKTAAASRFK